MTKKLLSRRNLITVGVAGAFLLYLGAFLSDDRAVDDQDLRSEGPLVPPDENAYHWLAKALESRGNDLTITRGKELQERARQNGKALELIHRAAACDIFVPPPIQEVSNNDREMAMTGAIVQLCAEAALERGDVDLLWKTIQADRRLGRLRSEHPTTSATPLNCLHRKMERFTRRAIELQDSPETLRQWAVELSKPILVDDWQARALRRHYGVIVLQFEDPKMKDHLASQFESSTILYRKNRTLSLVADLYRGWISDLEAGEPVEPTLEKSGTLVRILQRLGGNYLGERFVELQRSTVPFSHHDQQVTAGRANNALLRIAIALRQFSLEHDRYPTQLQDLVPRFLSEVPADPHDRAGGAMRWDPSRRVLWSVGVDGADDRAPASPRHPGGTIDGRGKPDRTLILPELK